MATTTVMHHRFFPVDHRFDYPMTQVWVDPDRLGAFCNRSRLWSHRRAAPAQIRRRDYFLGASGPIGSPLRALAKRAIGYRPEGPIRMLTQPRLWGWLFNPITVYLLWHRTDQPSAAVLEVTNTPWKERIHYPVALRSNGDTLSAVFDKSMHVSPFLKMDCRYSLGLTTLDDTRFAITIDVEDNNRTILATSMIVTLQKLSSRNLVRPLYRNPFATLRTTAGIHHQATKLWKKKVPILRHPNNEGSKKTS